MHLTDSEKTILAEWLGRMRNKEPGLFRKEIPEKLVLIDSKRIPKLSDQRLQRQVELGKLILAQEVGHLHLYTYKEFYNGEEEEGDEEDGS